MVGDTEELHTAHGYIEMVARQQGINARAFRDEAAALRWMRGSVGAARRYRFTRRVIDGAPEDPGVYALWDGEEVIYYGRDALRLGDLQGSGGARGGAAGRAPAHVRQATAPQHRCLIRERL
jgi:hypothetical protein